MNTQKTLLYTENTHKHTQNTPTHIQNLPLYTQTHTHISEVKCCSVTNSFQAAGITNDQERHAVQAFTTSPHTALSSSIKGIYKAIHLLLGYLYI